MGLDFCDGQTSHGGHAVACVGYDMVEDVFIFKNSWGDNWGEGGYFRAKMGACGSTGQAWYSAGLVQPNGGDVSYPGGLTQSDIVEEGPSQEEPEFKNVLEQL